MSQGENTPKAILDEIERSLRKTFRKLLRFAVSYVRDEGDVGDPQNGILVGDLVSVYVDDKIIVSHEVIVPGVRTLPNGDPGYPDDVDVEELGIFPLTHATKATSFVAKTLVGYFLDDLFLAEEEDRMAREANRC